MATRRISITDGTDTVTLSKDLEFTIQPEDIGASATMADGSTVLDIVGVKNVLTVPVGWLSRTDVSKLRRMINTKHILSVTYPDIDGDKTSNFLISQPEYKAMKYTDDGADIWLGMELVMTQQGVE